MMQLMKRWVMVLVVVAGSALPAWATGYGVAAVRVRTFAAPVVVADSVCDVDAVQTVVAAPVVQTVVASPVVVRQRVLGVGYGTQAVVVRRGFSTGFSGGVAAVAVNTGFRRSVAVVTPGVSVDVRRGLFGRQRVIIRR